jgi:hypothetical protein
VFLKATPIVCLCCFHLLSLRSFVCSARSEGYYLRWSSVHDSGGLYLPPIYERAVPSFLCVQNTRRTYWWVPKQSSERFHYFQLCHLHGNSSNEHSVHVQELWSSAVLWMCKTSHQ